MKRALALLGCLVIAACQLPQTSLDVAQQNYEQCLAANSATPHNCDGLGRIYQIEHRDSLESQDDSDKFFQRGKYAPKPQPAAPAAVPNPAYQPR